jgi:hypothetical protein
MRKPSQFESPNAASGSRPAPVAGDAEQGPLSEQDFALLERAFERRRVLARGVTLARANGYSVLATGLLCLPFAAFDRWLLLAALVLSGSGVAELRGARMLQQLDLRAPRWLGLNQLVLLLAIALYCAANIYAGLSAPSPTAEIAQEHPDLAGQLSGLAENLSAGSGVDHAYRTAMVGFYLALLGACALYQGFCARYYFSRAPLLRAQLEQTPAWVLRAQRRLLGW